MRAAIYARYSAGPRQTDQSVEGGVLATSRAAFSKEVFNFIDKCSTRYAICRTPNAALIANARGILLAVRIKDEQ